MKLLILVAISLFIVKAFSIRDLCSPPFVNPDYKVRINKQFSGWTKSSAILVNTAEVGTLYRYCARINEDLYWIDVTSDTVILKTSSSWLSLGLNVETVDCNDDEWLSIDQVEYFNPGDNVHYNIRDTGTIIGIIAVSLDGHSMQIYNSSSTLLATGSLVSGFGLFSEWSVHVIESQLASDPRVAASLLTMFLWREIDAPDICSLCVWFGIPFLVFLPFAAIILVILVVLFLVYRKKGMYLDGKVRSLRTLRRGKLK